MSPIECRGFIAQWDTRLQPVDPARRNPVSARGAHAAWRRCCKFPKCKSASSRPTSAAASATRRSWPARKSACAGLPCACGYPVRWLEDRREHAHRERELPRTSLRHDGLHRSDTANSSPSRPRPRSIPAPIRPIRSPRRSSPRRSAPSCPAPTTFRSIAARPRRSSPTSARNCPIAASRDPNCLLCHGADDRRDRAADRQGAATRCALANLVRPEQMPFDNVTDKHFDSGDYPQLLRKAVDAIDLPGVRERQTARRTGRPADRPRHLGVLRADRARHDRRRQAPRALRAGLRAHYAGRSARGARRHPEHRAGAGNHAGADRAASVSASTSSDVQVKLGDTELSPYSSGAWGSRGIVWAGGATARACKELAERVARIGAAMLQTDVNSVTVRDGGVFGPSGNVSLSDIARAYLSRARRICRAISTRTGSKSPAAMRRRA